MYYLGKSREVYTLYQRATEEEDSNQTYVRAYRYLDYGSVSSNVLMIAMMTSGIILISPIFKNTLLILPALILLCLYIIVANYQFALFSYEVEVLWQCCKNRTLVHFVPIPHSRTIQDTNKRKDNTVITNDNIVFYVNKWKYLTAISNLCSWRNLGFWTNYTTHTFEY